MTQEKMKQKPNNRYTPQTTKNIDITRKEALIKAGKYAAFTAATMLVILSPKASQAQSPSSPTPGWD